MHKKTHLPIVVIGAGIGGLSAAIHLASAGERVVILEQNDHVGGKMHEVRQAGYRWDTGPSIITMRYVFDELFRSAGRDVRDYLDLQPLRTASMNYFPNGELLEFTRNLPEMLEQIQRIERRDVDGYLRFLAYTARLYRLVSPLFIFNRPPRLRDILRVSPVEAARFDGLRSMNQAIESHIRSPQLRQFLGRFATYVGASPYRAPATLNVIAHIELNQGLWYPIGGVYSIARAFARLAIELGAEIRTACKVDRIQVEDGRAMGVILSNGEVLPARAVLANIDPALVYADLLPPHVAPRRLASLLAPELSCSAFIILLGVRGTSPQLAHHNTFFSSDYPAEFAAMFRRGDGAGAPPLLPSIYLSITSKADPADAPPGCENWFIQINVPPLGPGWDWRQQAETYADQILEILAERGIDIRSKVETRRLITPLDLAQRTAARQGALYGASSNSRLAAFRRPHNRCPDVRGLYFAGGAAHPGGGVPMVILSGNVASALLLEDLRLSQQ